MAKDKVKTSLRLCRGEEVFSADSLRNYQQETVDVLKRMDDERGRFSTLVNLPTGAGKTRIAICFCLNVLSKGAKVLWIADRISLLEQVIEEFSKYSSEKDYNYQLICGQSGNGDIDKDTGVEPLKREPLSQIREDANIIFASVGTIAGVAKKECEEFRNWIDRSQEDEQKLYIIYDEAHHIGAFKVYDFFASLICNASEDTRTDIHYRVERFGIIGFTATVYRGDRYLDVFLEWFKDGYNCGNGELYHIKSEYGSADLVGDESVKWNRVTIVDLKELVSDYKGEPSVLVKPKIIKVSEYKDGKPESKDNEMEYLADRICKHYKKWGKTAVIVGTKSEAERLEKLLSKDGVACFAFISGSENNRKELSIFRNSGSESKILIAINMLDEGIDIPDLNTLYLYAQTRSQIVLRQRIGRVLRKAKDKDKQARVIWQYYPSKCENLSDEKFHRLLESDFIEAPESEEELRRDIEEWKNNKDMPIPPAMYLEPLPEDKLSPDYYYSSMYRLKAVELFGRDVISEAESVGFYYDAETFRDTNEVIYVRDLERKGYRQLLRVLQNDGQTVLRNSDCTSFKKYAELLGVDENTLLEDIKLICFYLSDVRRADTSGRRIKKRIFVRDEDIETFCHWYMTGQIEYRQIKELGIDAKTKQQADKGLFEYYNTDSAMKAEYSKDAKKLKVLKDIIQKRGAKPLLKVNTKKEYTDLLEYDGFIYQEVQSVKSLLRMGAIDKDRIEAPQHHGKDWAFMGKTGGVEKEVFHIKRKMNSEFRKADWLLIAHALVDMPNHIWITQQDVDEYEEKLISRLGVPVNIDREQIVKEFLMALGYAKNENIIRKQCEIFGKDLPRLLQYILYEKAYNLLSEEINFEDKDGKIQTTCQNKKELQKKYGDFLSDYGVQPEVMRNLSPVEDVIYDCRPYFKVVPYYQGIKPEFLCRMVNDIIQLPKRSNQAVDTVIDAFGGSGACTLNGFYKEITPKLIYNDLGIMNTSFYKCLSSGDIETEVDRFLKDAFSLYDAQKDTITYFKKYEKYLSEKRISLEEESSPKKQAYLDKVKRTEEILGQTIEKMENAYVKKRDACVKSYRNKELEAGLESYQAIYLENRLKYLNNRFVDSDDTELCKACRSVERYLHVFMMKASALYLTMTEETELVNVHKHGIEDVDLGVLFLLYNTFSNRHFYSDCTIELIGEFINNYKDRLNYGKELFKNVDILQKNAIKLLRCKKYNLENTVWYLDIPYVGTDSTDYVPGWFKVNSFIESLGQCKGTYIVSSRRNICLPNETKAKFANKTQRVEDDIPDDMIENGTAESFSPAQEKELNMFSFYNSFICPEVAEEYEELISTLNDVKENKEMHLPKEKAAKYVLIPYTKMQEEFFKEQDKNVKAKRVENNTKVSRQYVLRMLAATHFSNIPVEVMITNADIKIDEMPIQKVGEGVYVLPTFKTGVDATQYMIEPAVIILDYERYINILMSLLYHDEYKKYIQDKNAKTTAEYFRNFYSGYFKK